MMSGIRGKNTKIEVSLRHALFAMGYRYRINTVGLPGKPDIVFPRYHAVVFVHGCFWHSHAGCHLFRIPATNTDFWEAKLLGNRVHDGQVREKLKGLGWRVATVWECSLRGKPVGPVAARVAAWLDSESRETEISGEDR